MNTAETTNGAQDKGAPLIHKDYFDACDLAIKEALFLLQISAKIIAEQAEESLLRDNVEDTILPACGRLEDAWQALMDRDDDLRERWRRQNLRAGTSHQPSAVDERTKEIIAKFDALDRLEIAQNLRSGAQALEDSAKAEMAGGAQ